MLTALLLDFFFPFLGGVLGCSVRQDANCTKVTDKVACLEKIPYEELIKIQAVEDAGFGPVVDGVELPYLPIVMLRKGAFDPAVDGIMAGTMAEDSCVCLVRVLPSSRIRWATAVPQSSPRVVHALGLFVDLARLAGVSNAELAAATLRISH